MAEAEKSVYDAAANIPAEICNRFDTAEKFSDKDQHAIVEIVRQALASFVPKPDDDAKTTTPPTAEESS